MRSKFILLLTLIASSCDGGGVQPGGPGCRDGKCDTSSWATQALAGRADPIANWLRQAPVDANGRLPVDSFDLVKIREDVAKARGCSAIDTYVVSDDVLHPGQAFPRIISTVCRDHINPDSAAESKFFGSAPFADDTGNDVD